MHASRPSEFQPLEADVGVIGGGPAGSVTALRLAKLGYSVILVERERFPRRHVGESLPPSILPQLHFLGLADRINAAGFLRPRASVILWGGDTRVVKSFGPTPGFQVDRGRFDEILLDAARQAGVRVLQPAAVERPASIAADTWQLFVVGPDHRQAMNVRFLVDATGRHGWLRGETTRESPPTIALYGYWKGHGIDGVESRVEAADNHWLWGAPLPDGSFNATVFLDASFNRNAPRVPLENAYFALLAESRMFGQCLQGRLLTPVKGCDSTSYSTASPVGRNWIKVGDAAYALDPLSSQGIQSAVRSAIQAATIVHTMLATPASSALAARFYERQIADTVVRNRQSASSLYAIEAARRRTPFWLDRSPLVPPPDNHDSTLVAAVPRIATRVRISRESKVVATPVICDNLVVERPALVHPRLGEPVAFLCDKPVTAFLAACGSPCTVAELISCWSTHIPLRVATEIVAWLWKNNVLVAVDEEEVEPSLIRPTLDSVLIYRR